MNKEVNDALHTLLSMALENEKYTTQKEQYDIVHKEIERLHSIIKEAINKTNDIEFRIAGKDFNYYFKLKDIEQGKELLQILDKVERANNDK